MLGSNENRKSGAVVVFERFGRCSLLNSSYRKKHRLRLLGEQTLTTTESPISTTIWPEHSVNDSIYYSNAITKTTNEVDFYDNETISEIRWVISQMAIDFCEQEAIPLAENITLVKYVGLFKKMCLISFGLQ